VRQQGRLQVFLVNVHMDAVCPLLLLLVAHHSDPLEARMWSRRDAA
jgi:hypothetical protein